MGESVDPRSVAEERFTAAGNAVASLDLAGLYATDPPTVIRELVDAVRPQAPGAHICELGFGTGWLLEELIAAYPEARVCGLDMSPGMTKRAQELYGGRAGVVRADMEWLPFCSETFDVVVTCWTLYFMRDIDAALEGIKRCLRQGGRIIAATVAADNLAEYDEMRESAFRTALGREADADSAVRFDLETGLPYMRRHFARVERREWRGEMALPQARHVVQLWEGWRPHTLSDREVELVRAEMLRLASERLARDGVIRLRRHSGMFVGLKE